MIAIIKDIYQELSNRKRISIIDVFVSLLVIRITDHFVDINTYFSKIFNNKIISSIIPILTGFLHCLNILIIIVFIICILSLISYSVLNAISSRTHYDLLRFIYDMHYTSTHSIDFMTTLFFYMISIGLFLELASKFDIYNYIVNITNNSPFQLLQIPYVFLSIAALIELYNRYFRAKIPHDESSKITVNKPIEIKIVEDSKKNH